MTHLTSPRESALRHRFTAGRPEPRCKGRCPRGCPDCAEDAPEDTCRECDGILTVLPIIGRCDCNDEPETAA